MYKQNKYWCNIEINNYEDIHFCNLLDIELRKIIFMFKVKMYNEILLSITMCT